MNLFRLIKMLLSPKLFREIFLFFQITMMVVFINIVFVPFEQERQLRNELHQVFSCDYNKLIHFNPNVSYIEQERSQLNNMITSINQDEEISDILLMQTNQAKLSSEYSEVFSNMFIYSNSLFQKTDIKLACGSFAVSGNDNVLPIIISDSLADIFPLNTEVTASFPQNSDLQVVCRVTGIMKANTVLPSINYYGSLPSLSVLGLNMYSLSNYNFIVAVESPILENIIEWGHRC